jgi:hypothetical protein
MHGGYREEGLGLCDHFLVFTSRERRGTHDQASDICVVVKNVQVLIRLQAEYIATGRLLTT